MNIQFDEQTYKKAMSKYLLLILFLLTLCATAHSQSDYYIRQAQGYMRDADYYSRHQDYDKAQTRTRWAKEASEKAKTRMEWAAEAREKARTRMKWAQEAMEKAKRSSQ